MCIRDRLYLDEDAQIRFAKVAPSDLIMIYESDSGHAQPMAAIRRVRSVDKDKNVILKVEFWNAYPVSYTHLQQDLQLFRIYGLVNQRIHTTIQISFHFIDRNDDGK